MLINERSIDIMEKSVKTVDTLMSIFEKDGAKFAKYNENSILFTIKKGSVVDNKISLDLLKSSCKLYFGLDLFIKYVG